MSDASILANAKRQAELEARGRDLTKQMPPPGQTGESLRQIKGMEQITDEMLAERANFNLREHMKGKSTAVTVGQTVDRVDLSAMSPDELSGLLDATMREMAQREGKP